MADSCIKLNWNCLKQKSVVLFWLIRRLNIFKISHDSQKEEEERMCMYVCMHVCVCMRACVFFSSIKEKFILKFRLWIGSANSTMVTLFFLYSRECLCSTLITASVLVMLWTMLTSVMILIALEPPALCPPQKMTRLIRMDDQTHQSANDNNVFLRKQLTVFLS